MRRYRTLIGCLVVMAAGWGGSAPQAFAGQGVVGPNSPYSSFARKQNQVQIAKHLEADRVAAGLPDMVTVLNALDAATSGEQLRKAYDAYSPEPYVAFSSMSSAAIFDHLALVTGRQADQRPSNATRRQSTREASKSDGPGLDDAGGLSDKGWVTWWRVFDHSGRQDSTTETFRYAYGGLGVIGGVDRRFDRFHAGANLGINDSDLRYSTVDADGNLTALLVGAYGGFSAGSFFADLNAACSWNSNECDRSIEAVGLLDRHLHTEFDGTSAMVDARTGYDFELGRSGVILTPQLFAQYLRVAQDSVSERGGNTLGLEVSGLDQGSFRGGLGLGLARAFKGERYTFIPKLLVEGLAQSSSDRVKLESRLTGSPIGVGWFQTYGSKPSESLVHVSLGLTMTMRKQASLFVSVDGSYSDALWTRVVSGGIEWLF